MHTPKRPTKKSARKLTDIIPPGQSLPSASGRPVIIKHERANDPMVVNKPKPEAETSEKAEQLISAAKKVTIKPLTDPKPELTDEKLAAPNFNETPPKANEAQSSPSNAAGGAAVNEPEAKNEAQSPQSVEKTPSNEPEPEITLDSKSQEKLTDAKQEKVKSEAIDKDIEHRRHIDELVESGKYFVPIDTVGRRARRNVAFGIVLIIILALAWLDVALDAGIIHLAGIHPLTHFFTQ